MSHKYLGDTCKQVFVTASLCLQINLAVLFFPIMQSFENSLKELEPPDSLRKKIQEKNHQMRQISEEINEIHTKQMDIKNESEQYRDAIRYKCSEWSLIFNVSYVPYSGKLSREKTFTNFTIIEPSTKVFSMKFGRAIPTYDRL